MSTHDDQVSLTHVRPLSFLSSSLPQSLDFVAYNATFKTLYKQLALNCSTALMRLTCVELYLPCVVIPIPLGPPPIPGTHTTRCGARSRSLCRFEQTGILSLSLSFSLSACLHVMNQLLTALHDHTLQWQQ